MIIFVQTSLFSQLIIIVNIIPYEICAGWIFLVRTSYFTHRIGRQKIYVS